MAAGEDARSIPPKQLLTCHPRLESGNVTCILCDNVYCKPDFEKKCTVGKGFFSTNSQGVCAEHYITYKFKHVQDVNSPDYDQMQMLRLKAELINQEILNLNEISNNETTITEDSVEDEAEKCVKSVMSSGMLKRENNHLNRLVKEMEIRNKELSKSKTFLRKNIENNSCINGKNITSYSNVLQNIQNKTEHVSLIVKPNKEFTGDALAFMQSK